MSRTIGFASILIVLAVGLYLYGRQTQALSQGGVAPGPMVDVIAVRSDLLAMANAERAYWASNAKYASLEDLRNNGDVRVHNRVNYTYSAETSDAAFRITATYSGPDPKAPKRISVDQTMEMKSE
jgi:hypothetical protein